MTPFEQMMKSPAALALWVQVQTKDPASNSKYYNRQFIEVHRS